MGNNHEAQLYQCEVLVAGAGAAGMSAALQAARLGVDTVLLTQGTSLGEGERPLAGLPGGGAQAFHEFGGETGICLELEEEFDYHWELHTAGKPPVPEGSPSEGEAAYPGQLMEALWRDKLQAAGVRVMTQQLVSAVETEGRRVVAVTALNLATEGATVRIEPSVAVLDSTTEGLVAGAAGAICRTGCEGKDEFGERSAPAEGTTTVGGTATDTASGGAAAVNSPPADTAGTGKITAAGQPVGERGWLAALIYEGEGAAEPGTPGEGRGAGTLDETLGPVPSDDSLSALLGDTPGVWCAQLPWRWLCFTGDTERPADRQGDKHTVSSSWEPSVGSAADRLTSLPSPAPASAGDWPRPQSQSKAGEGPLHHQPPVTPVEPGEQLLQQQGKLSTDEPLPHHQSQVARDAMAGKSGDEPQQDRSAHPLTGEGGSRETVCHEFYQWWNNLQQHPACAHWRLVWVSPAVTVKKQRRFEGAVTVTQTDLEQPVAQADRLAYGGFALQQYTADASGAPRLYQYSVPPLYDLPYRMTYSSDFDNLYLGGQLVSTTCLAHGSVSQIKTGALLGQGTAVAMAVAKKYGCSAHEVCEKHLAEVQQELLRHDGSLINLPANDSRDLARQAQVTASSQWLYDDLAADQQVPLSGKQGVMLYDWPRYLSEIQVYLTNPTADKQPLRAQVLYASEKLPEYREPPAPAEAEAVNRLHQLEDQMSQLREASRVTLMVPAGFAGWFSCPLPSRLRLLGRNRRFRHQGLALIIEGRKMTVGFDARPCEVAQRVVLNGEKLQLSEGRLAIKTDETIPSGEAQQVINGVARRFARAPLNMWVSAPGVPLPQWVELRLTEPALLQRIALTFDHQGWEPKAQTPGVGEAPGRAVVSDYQLLVEQAGAWVELLTVNDNYRRFRVHEFAPVEASAVRLVVTGTGDPQGVARVAEIRLEGPPGDM